MIVMAAAAGSSQAALPPLLSLGLTAATSGWYRRPILGRPLRRQLSEGGRRVESVQ